MKKRKNKFKARYEDILNRLELKKLKLKLQKTKN